MTGNFTCENTVNEFLPFSTFNWCHRYTSVKMTAFYINSCDLITTVLSDLLEWCLDWYHSITQPRKPVLDEVSRRYLLYPYPPHYKSPTALSHMHHLTCGISSLLHYVNLILFTLPPGSPHPAHITSSQSPPSLASPFTPDLKLISFTNPFLHSHSYKSYSFRTAFMDF